VLAHVASRAIRLANGSNNNARSMR
jgi:hypothetical protein